MHRAVSKRKSLDILLRFCSYPVALTADIQKAFLMVSVSDSCGLTTSLSSTLNAAIDHHLKLFSSANPQLVKILLCSIYVDDVVTGAADEYAALKLYEESKGNPGFNLQKLTANVPQVQRAINRMEKSPLDSTTVCSSDRD